MVIAKAVVSTIGTVIGTHGSYTFFKGLKISPQVTTAVSEDKGVNLIKRGSVSVSAGSDDKNENKSELCVNNSNKNNSGTDNELKLSADRKPHTLILGLGDCIPVRPIPDSLIESLAEIRMIWKDKSENGLLISLRLYFLPENAPLGRNCHGEDELVAVADKVVIRAEDFVSWIVEDMQWNWGLLASYNDKATSPPKLISTSNGLTTNTLLSSTRLDLSEIEKEKFSGDSLHTNVSVLSYPRYCRYRATMRRLENTVEDKWIFNKLMEALSGFVASRLNTRIMFCRDTIDYPDLESHELLCNHLAPKIKGRPRGKRKKTVSSDGSSVYHESVDGSETNDSDVSAFSAEKAQAGTQGAQSNSKALLKKVMNPSQPARAKTKSECSISEPKFTKLSTGRITKQRLQLTPDALKPNKSKQKHLEIEYSEDDSESSDDDSDDDDYEDKYVERKMKYDGNLNGSKRRSSGEDTRIPRDVKEQKELKAVYEEIKEEEPILSVTPTIKDEVEREFLARLNQFMSERAYPCPKQFWMGLRDVNLYAIYSRVQKLGGYECIGDNRVWKQIFEDIAASSVNGAAINSMTRKKYERILLPFERYERELLNLASLAPNASPEITISTISKASASSSRPRSSSPAVEIIPMKNGAVTGDNIELTKEQMCEIQNIIKQKDNQMVHHLNSLSNDGISLPISVIVRPQSTDDNTLRAKYNNASDSGNNMFPFGRSHPSVAGVTQEETSYYNNKMLRQSKGKQERKTPYLQIPPQQQPAASSQPAPSEKENIPLMLSKQSTTIIPISKDGQMYGDHVIELVDSDDEGHSSQAPPMKKKKLDILREGGLEVTPISHSQNGEFIFPRETSALLAMFPQLSNVKSRLEMPPPLTNGVSSKNHSKAKDKVTTTPATTTKCPPALFQSVSMYQTTTKIFGNPKDFLPAGPSYSNVTKSDGGLDLSVKPGSAGNLGQPGGSRKRMAAPPAAHTNLSKSNWPILPENLTITKKSPIAPLSYLPKKHYMNQVTKMAANSGNDLQITLVKSHQNPRRPTGNNEKKSSSTQPLPSSLLAAANAFSKMSPMSHFANGGFSLPGVDITPASLPHPMPQSASTRNLGKSSSSGNLPGNLPPAGNSMTGLASSLLPMFDPVYFQALYAANANPLNFQNFNLLPPELLKLYQNSIPSSKS